MASPSRPALRVRPMPVPRAIAPASAIGPPMLGRAKPRRKRLRGDGQPLRSSQRRRPRPCGSDQQSSTRRSETRQRRSPGRRAGRARPLCQSRPGRARALRQGDAGRLRLLRRRAPRILHALAPDLPPQPDAGADVLVPLEAVGLLRPAEHAPPFAKAKVETGMPLPLRPTLRPIVALIGRGNALVS